MKKSQIFEVGPRDGLQNYPKIFTLGQKEKFVQNCLKAGLSEIEVGSFVRPDWIPQLADTAKLIARIQKYKKAYTKQKPQFWAFVPNSVGLSHALDTEIDGVSFFTAASETFCRKNVNRSQKELLQLVEEMMPLALKAKRKVRVYISTVTYCPYEGAIRPSQVVKVVRPLMDLGVTDISLGDTTGHATPADVRKLLSALLKYAPASKLSMHLHDTRALSLANVWESLQHGVSRFDSSLGGLGGCPYAPGAAGNLPTEDLAYFLQQSKLLKPKVDLERLAEASFWLEKQIGETLPSKVLKTLRKQK